MCIHKMLGLFFLMGIVVGEGGFSEWDSMGLGDVARLASSLDGDLNSEQGMIPSMFPSSMTKHSTASKTEALNMAPSLSLASAPQTLEPTNMVQEQLEYPTPSSIKEPPSQQFSHLSRLSIKPPPIPSKLPVVEEEPVVAKSNSASVIRHKTERGNVSHNASGPKKHGIEKYQKVANVDPLSTLCPLGWKKYDKSCYYFSRDRLNWWKAHAKCEFMGGYLVVANYAHENSYLKIMCKKMGLSTGAWFGLNDIMNPKSHTWYWGFGKKECKWFDWSGKEPKYGGSDRNCVCFRENHEYNWSVDNCGATLYYICELKPKHPCTCTY